MGDKERRQRQKTVLVGRILKKKNYKVSPEPQNDSLGRNPLTSNKRLWPAFVRSFFVSSSGHGIILNIRLVLQFYRS